MNYSSASKEIIETAKRLIKSGQNRQALLIVKDSLKKFPSSA
jgi:3-oxoacyl-[acyl-carrier-protein] synthase III